MIARIGSGWQYVLADLSLILFMVTAAAVCEAPPKAAAASDGLASGEPVAVWREARGGPSLGEWLAGQPTDPRQRLTLVFHGTPAAAAPAFEEALAHVAGQPRPLRLQIEPAEGGPLEAWIAYDLSPKNEGAKP